MSEASETTTTNHNHITGDVKQEGQCPGCDLYWSHTRKAPTL